MNIKHFSILYPHKNFNLKSKLIFFMVFYYCKKEIINRICFSDLFGKAKKKILKQNEVSENFSVPLFDDKKYKEIDWGEQEIGIFFKQFPGPKMF